MSRYYIRAFINGKECRATSSYKTTVGVVALFDEITKYSDKQLRKFCSYRNPDSVHGTVRLELVSKKDKSIIKSYTRNV